MVQHDEVFLRNQKTQQLAHVWNPPEKNQLNSCTQFINTRQNQHLSLVAMQQVCHKILLSHLTTVDCFLVV